MISDDRVIIHLVAPDATNIYQYRDAEPTWLAGGALLESLRLAGSAWRRRIEWIVDGDQIVVDFLAAPDLEPDPLFAALHLRSVNRGAYRRRPLSMLEKSALLASVAEDLEIDWFETAGERWKIARLGGMATDIRLRAPEAFAVHQQVIDWNRAFSPTGLPSRALGLASASLPLMRWAMRDWSRMSRLNRVPGTWATRAQLDYIPFLASGACFAMRIRGDVTGDRATVLARAGAAVQRFWLTATNLGLAMQPNLAIVAFAEYGARDSDFTQDPALRVKAGALSREFELVFGHDPKDIVFIGRIGEARPGLPRTRSVRRAVAELSINAPLL